MKGPAADNQAGGNAHNVNDSYFDQHNRIPEEQALTNTNTQPSITRSMSANNNGQPNGTRHARQDSAVARPPGPQTPGRRPSYQGRNLSFYDMKELKKTGTLSQPTAAPDSQYTWVNGKGADAISEYGTSVPPHMGAPVGPPHNVDEPSLKGLPWIRWMNSTAKNHFVASIGEFVGTTMFLFFAFAGTEVANIGSDAPAGTTTTGTTGFSTDKLLYIAISFGFSLMVNVWIFFRISGALFNPAVTFAMLLVGALKPLRALCLFLSQIVGSIAASAIVLGLFPARLNVNTTLSAPTSRVRGVFIEAFLTAELIFTILMLAKEKHRSTFIAPVGIGLALFIGELVGVFYTGGSLNPARTFGPAVVTNTWDSNHWIYWVGPILGSLIALAFYQFIKLLEYEMANPGQDADPWNDPTQNPDHEVRVKQRDKTARVMQTLGLDHFGFHSEPQVDEEAQSAELQSPTRSTTQGDNTRAKKERDIIEKDDTPVTPTARRH